MQSVTISTRGFTLLELLITIAIIILVTGGAIASYRSFSTKQELVQEAQRVKNNLRAAQTAARSGSKPKDQACVIMDAIRVSFTSNVSYAIGAACNDGGNPPTPFIVNEKTTTLGSSVTLSLYPAWLQFNVLSSGATFSNASSSVTICLTNSSQKSYKLVVKEGGEIQDDGITVCP